MLRTLLAGLDGTEASHGVLNLGIRWARRYDALLVGTVVIDEPGLHGPEEWVLGENILMRRINQNLLHEMTRKTEQILGIAAVRCAEEGVAFKPLQNVGDPYVQIPEESHRFDLILLGQETHFQFGFEKTPDDTLTRILRCSPRPVVVVPRAVGSGEAVVIAFDGSLQASRALYAFEASGLGRGRDVHVVSIAPEHKAAAELADRAVEFLAYHEIRAMPSAVASSDAPDVVLLDRAKEFAAGLIVMGVYGQAVLREFFVGSTTRAVLKETPVPLFVTH